MGNILEVTGLNKSYKDFSLTDVSFTLPEDCITGFIGINGAGKTTTIRAILGLAQKTSGVIKVFGKDFEKNEREIKNRIGVVLDEGYFYDDLTMAEMKSVIAPAYTEWSESDFKGYMDRFSLNPRQKISSLSKGMRMKYALSLALSHKADLLIMDEPTSGLDPLIRSQLLDIMTDYMKQGGKGVFFSTHITSDLDKVADMIILIHGGKIQFEKERDFLFDNYRLVKGDTKALNDENRKLFRSIQTTDYGFSGITDKISEVQRSISDIVAERPTIEDIMLAHIEGVQE
jgi:ABC-2 type transport system ATP-binding protein